MSELRFKWKGRPETRPRFEMTTAYGPDQVIAKVRSALKQSRTVVGQAFRDRVELTVPRRATHLWSPQLFVEVKPREGGGSKLLAQFAPHPHVWSMYVAACAIASMLTFGALILAFAQWVMDDTLWGLWIAPGTALLAALMFGAAFVGQGLSAPQMFELRDFLRETLGAEPAAGSAEDGTPPSATPAP